MVFVQPPAPSAVVVPRDVPPRNSSTVLLASAVPVKVGALMLVLLSVDEIPLSLAVVMSGVETAGAVVSIVMVKPGEAAEAFPAASVAVAAMVCGPCASVPVVVTA